jgi:GMP synthase (glutamine-hydrolysing)
MKNILIIKCGSTYQDIKSEHLDFEDWIIAQSNLPQNVFKVFDLPNGDQLRHPGEFIAAIITGSHHNVDQRLPWIKALKDWIITARYSNIPVLGICFGHQIIAEALGGKVEKSPNGIAEGAVSLTLTTEGKNDPLFKGLGNILDSYASHAYSVSKLPFDAKLLATSNGGMVEAFSVEKIYGVQFHPEFTEDVMKKYLAVSNKMPLSPKRYKLKFEEKNQMIIPNFLDISLKF